MTVKSFHARKIFDRIKLIAFLLLPFFPVLAKCQPKFSYTNIPREYSDLNRVYFHIASAYQNITELQDYLPDGYVTDGTIDYTDFIQKGIDQNDKVILPNFPILVSSKGLTLNDNNVLIFQEKSKLILEPNSLETYEIIRIHNVSNVKVYNPVIEGDRIKHRGRTGQWGMGIAIRSSQDVSILNPVISNCWGDGIYIGQIKYQPSENIVIEGGIIDNNRRNGISVTNVNGLQICNTIVANTNGQSPASGIDIEPNSHKDVINNILIKDIRTFNNQKYGIIISLNKLAGRSKRDVNIDILGHIDDRSAGGLAINRVYGDYKTLPFTGRIKISKSVWQNNRGRTPLYYIKQNHGYRLQIDNFKIKKTDEEGNVVIDKEAIGNARKKLSF